MKKNVSAIDAKTVAMKMKPLIELERERQLSIANTKLHKEQNAIIMNLIKAYANKGEFSFYYGRPLEDTIIKELRDLGYIVDIKNFGSYTISWEF